MRARLSSNRGDSWIELRRLTQVDDEIHCALEWSGTKWDGDHVFPAKFDVRGGLWVRAMQLRQLHRMIVDWNSLPLAELAKTPLRGQVELANELCLSFRELDDLVPGAPGHVGCVAEIRFGGFEQRISMHVDSSCLALFAEGLERLIAGVEEPE